MRWRPAAARASAITQRSAVPLSARTGRDLRAQWPRSRRRRARRRRRAAFAAALRIAHFATSNDHGLGQRAPHLQLRQRAFGLLARATEGRPTSRPRRYACAPPSWRAAVYLDRYLNVPPAPPRGDDAGLAPAELRRLPRCLRPPAAGRGGGAARGQPPRRPSTRRSSRSWVMPCCARMPASTWCRICKPPRMYQAWQGDPEAAPI